MIADFYEDFQLLGRVTTPDGVGGAVYAWTEDVSFRGGMAQQRAVEYTPAGLSTLCVRQALLHEPGMTLHLNDCVKRLRDGSMWRVTAESDEHRTPACADQPFAQVTVERWVDGV